MSAITVRSPLSVFVNEYFWNIITIRKAAGAILTYEQGSNYAAAQIVLNRELERQKTTICRTTGLIPNAAWEALAEKRTATRPCPPATLLNLHLAFHLKRRVNADHQFDFLGRSRHIAPTKQTSISLIHYPLRAVLGRHTTPIPVTKQLA